MQNISNMQTEPMTSEPEFLTAEEVGARLRLPLSTVYHLAKSGVLPAMQLGRSWRFPSLEIKQLATRKQGGARILVVDDDEVTRTFVTGVLAPRGCLVAEATNVRDGLTEARRQRFDLLLVDLKMPGGDGTELIQELKIEYSLSQMVLITAFPDLAQMKDPLDLGALTLLRKPLAAHQLVDCAERILGRALPEVAGRKA